MDDVIFVNNGMNSDSDPSVQPNDTYCYGLNGNLISQGNNKYSHESVKGTTIAFSLPNYTSLSFPAVTSLIPHGFISLGNKLVVFSANEIGDSQIGLVTVNDAGTGIYEIKYHNNGLDFSLDHMIRGYGLVENGAYERVYWTDDNKQPRTANLAAKVLNTPYICFNLARNSVSFII